MTTAPCQLDASAVITIAGMEDAPELKNRSQSCQPGWCVHRFLSSVKIQKNA